MQQLTNLKLWVMLLFFVSSFSQKNFSNDDYTILNIFLQKYQETIYNVETNGIYDLYKDSIFLKKQADISFNSQYLLHLRKYQSMYEKLNAQCNEIKLHVNNTEFSNACQKKKKYAGFQNILDDGDETFLSAQTEVIRTVEATRIKNKKITVAESSRFTIKNVKQKIGDKNIWLFITGLNYNKNKDVAFFTLTESKVYADNGSLIAYANFCIVFQKKQNQWEMIGNIESLDF